MNQKHTTQNAGLLTALQLLLKYPSAIHLNLPTKLGDYTNQDVGCCPFLFFERFGGGLYLIL